MEQTLDKVSSQVDFVTVKDLTKIYGNATVVNNISFTIKKGEMVTLLGPSGCGKSTTLRCIAGLETLDGGEILINNELVSSAEKGFSLPPEKRDIGMVFQSYAVWPHMTVWSNIAYPLEVRHFPKNEIKERVEKILELIGLSEMAQRNVTKLSGGQQQRVVLARALVHNPRILLLDEPLSNLDARLRESMRFEIRRIQQEIGITALYVTHDQSEAMVLSDRVIVMRKGLIEQVGPPLEIYRLPKSSFVAAFFGAVNLIKGTIAPFEGTPKIVPVSVGTGEKAYIISALVQTGMKPGDSVCVCIRPQDLVLAAPSDTGTKKNTISGKVCQVIQMGNYVEYFVDIGEQKLLCQSSRDLALRVGSPADAILKPEYSICVNQ